MVNEWNTTDKKPGSAKITFRITTVPAGDVTMKLNEGDQVMTDGTHWWIASEEPVLVLRGNHEDE